MKSLRKIIPLFLSMFFYLDGSVYPLRISEVERDYNIDLLLIEKDGKNHYCLIKNLSRLLSKQVAKHDGALAFCRRCLNHFPIMKNLKYTKSIVREKSV